tara:strand:+ start:2223 stop:2429 length:207 start_codon:yes stop_codon:yes gene_type:complete
MIDADKYEEAFKEYPVSDYWPQVKRIQGHGMDLLAEVKRLRELLKDIADSSSANADYIKERIKEEVIE